MPEPPEYQQSAALLRRIGDALYRAPQAEPLAVQDIYDALNEDALSVDAALKKMERSELIELDLKGLRIRLLGYGRTTAAQGATAEVCLGRDYIVKRYDRAAVHIIVENNGGQSGATGFFTSDPLNSIATAAHVVQGRKILRITDSNGRELTEFLQKMRLGPSDLDLAILECQTPTDVEPIRVEWRPRATSPLSDLIVLGYPIIAGTHPSLHRSMALLHQTAIKYSGRDSLVISATQPGCSGGPVLDKRGFAIGIVEQENILHQAAGTNSFFSATPAHYLREII